MLDRAWGIARSLVMYHGIPGRQRRMARLYGRFLAPGDVAFDIGAHVGSRVRAWRRLGAHVVAVEPQPDCLRVLRLFFRRDRGVTIVPLAVGAKPGRARLALSTATPTVSTMSTEWIDSVTTDRSFARVRASWVAIAPAVDPRLAASEAVSTPSTSCATSSSRSGRGSRPSAAPTRYRRSSPSTSSSGVGSG